MFVLWARAGWLLRTVGCCGVAHAHELFWRLLLAVQKQPAFTTSASGTTLLAFWPSRRAMRRDSSNLLAAPNLTIVSELQPILRNPFSVAVKAGNTELAQK